jgi:hypothetical protein
VNDHIVEQSRPIHQGESVTDYDNGIVEVQMLSVDRVLMWRLVIVLTVVGLYLLVVWVIPVGDFLLSPHWQDWINRVPFDSEKWKAEERSAERLDMVVELQARHPLTGKTETDVGALLGPPSQELAGEAFPNAGCQRVWEYRLGPDRHSIGPAYAYYVVGFRDGRVVRTWRSSD